MSAYKNSATYYDVFVEPFNKTIRKIAAGIINIQRGQRILEVGCGTGTNLRIYQNKGCKVFGVDLSPFMLNMAKKKLGTHASLALGDASALAYSDHSFDLVIAMLTLHEMSPIKRRAVMDEITRVMKMDGRLLIVDFHHGRRSSLKALLIRGIILFFEISAGREHFRNHLQFLSAGGIPSILEKHNYIVEKYKILGKGNIGIFLAHR